MLQFRDLQTHTRLRCLPTELEGYIRIDITQNSLGETVYNVAFAICDSDGDRFEFPYVYEADVERERIVLREGRYGPSKLRAWLIGTYAAAGFDLLKEIRGEATDFLNEQYDPSYDEFAEPTC